MSLPDAVLTSATPSTAPPKRLNPKLTRRGKPPPAEEEKEGGLNFEVTNPRLNLLHTGTWISKQYENGRFVENTGMWSCCRDVERFSLYCESEEVKKQVIDQKKAMEREKLSAEEYKKYVTENLRVPWEKKELGNGAELDKLETPEERAIRESNIFGNPYNAPMLVSWVFKHVDEELTLTQGLTYMRKHVESAEGCTLLLRHDVLMCLLKVFDEWSSKPNILLFVISILRKLLDCNMTRESIIDRDGPGYTQVSALRLAFAILHSHMDSIPHVDEAMR